MGAATEQTGDCSKAVLLLVESRGDYCKNRCIVPVQLTTLYLVWNKVQSDQANQNSIC